MMKPPSLTPRWVPAAVSSGEHPQLSAISCRAQPSPGQNIHLAGGLRSPQSLCSSCKSLEKDVGPWLLQTRVSWSARPGSLVPSRRVGDVGSRGLVVGEARIAKPGRAGQEQLLFAGMWHCAEVWMFLFTLAFSRSPYCFSCCQLPLGRPLSLCSACVSCCGFNYL